MNGLLDAIHRRFAVVFPMPAKREMRCSLRHLVVRRNQRQVVILRSWSYGFGDLKQQSFPRNRIQRLRNRLCKYLAGGRKRGQAGSVENPLMLAKPLRFASVLEIWR